MIRSVKKQQRLLLTSGRCDIMELDVFSFSALKYDGAERSSLLCEDQGESSNNNIGHIKSNGWFDRHWLKWGEMVQTLGLGDSRRYDIPAAGCAAHLHPSPLRMLTSVKKSLLELLKLAN